MVWGRIDTYLETIPLTFKSEALCAYISTDAIAVDAAITMGASIAVSVGQGGQRRSGRRSHGGERRANGRRLHRERRERELYVRARGSARRSVRTTILRVRSLPAGRP